MHKLSTILGALTIGSAVAGGHAHAAVVTSIPGGTVFPFPAINAFGPGPENVAPGITWSSTNDDSPPNSLGSVFGYTGNYGFGGSTANGAWEGLNMIGLNSGFFESGVTDTMTIALAIPVSAIGGFLNYHPGGTTPTTIAIYDSTDTLIELTSLTFLTDGSDNSGQFYGFSLPTANISYFRLTDNYVGLTDLTILPAPVPLPAALPLYATGLGVMGLFGWWRRRRAPT